MKLKHTQLKHQLKKGFTLLELLVVVAIMAIIGGSIITAYDGLVSQSQKATATHTIGALTNSVRQYNVLEKEYPNNLESLMSAAPTAAGTFEAATLDTVVDATTDADAKFTAAPVKSGILGAKLAGKFNVTVLTDDQIDNLVEAGITRIRYTHVTGDDETAAALTNIFTAGNEADPTVGALSEISIPQHAFEAPRAGSDRNRGRGFALDFDDTASNLSAMVWAAGSAGYNNVKVGANPDAVLVGLGIGNASTLVDASGNSGDTTRPVGAVRLATAPYYGDVAKNSYQHYIALFDVSRSPAEFVAIVDSRGDFLDEEFAESTGQKK